LNTERVKVVHLITELSIGGSQMALLRLLEKLNGDLFSVSVVCWFNGQGVVAQRIRLLGIPVLDLGMGKKYQWGAFIRLLRFLRELQPVILHSWMFHANIPGRILGRLAHVPVIISSERTMGQEGWFRRRINQATAFLCDQIVCVSEAVARYAESRIGLPTNKVTVIPNGIDLDDFRHVPTRSQTRKMLGLPTDVLVVGSVGRPRPVKGFHLLLQAYIAIEKRFPDSRLVLVGNGPDEERLKGMAVATGLQHKIIFLNDRQDIPSVLQAFDLFVLPSIWEGMPNVLLEAMAASLPILATQVGGVAELLQPNQAGILVPPGDLHALTEAMAFLLANPELRKDLGNHARAWVETAYEIRNSVDKVESLYMSLLYEKGIRR
jgi:glycosyltransferase involved in cell wall biosynthesis